MFLNNLKKNLIILILILLIPSFGFAFVTVGSDANTCTYDNLHEAYLDADVTVRVTSEVVHSPAFVISKSKIFVGGYDNCSQANLGVNGLIKSKWSGINNGVVITVNANLAAQSIVSFANFEIYDGNDTSFAGAGGIRVFGKVSLVLVDSDVHDNTGHEGGGIRVTGEDSILIISNTKVRSNSATSAGGGIYCENGAALTIIGESAIISNTATNKGGGIFANSNCSINDQSGDVNSVIVAQHGIGLGAEFGIIANQAKFGGGVYLQGGSDMLLTGNDEHPASIDFNSSLNENEQITAGGGGVYMTGAGTTFTGKNAKIINNLANTGGAGIVVLDSAQFSMSRFSSPCWDNNACSVLSQNAVLYQGGIGGAGYIATGSVVDIAQTKIDANQAKKMSVFDIRQSDVRLEGNLITNNSARLNPFTSDNLFSLRDNSKLDFYYNTLVSNDSEGIFELRLKNEQELNVYNSIIWDQGDIYNELDDSGASLPIGQNVDFNCSYVHELISFSLDVSLINTFDINPSFVDSINDNYHLSNNSFALDACSEAIVQSQHTDLNGNNRGVDIIGVPDFLGPYDMGAYEYQNDVIFKNGFE